MIADLLLVVAMFGLLTSSIYLVLVLVGVAGFRSMAHPQPAELLPVTLLKPLHGVEPRLRENLESFFRQQYPKFEIIFGVRNEDDPALSLVRELMQQYPEVQVEIVISGEPMWPNAKVHNLSHMKAAASYDYFIISDSDVSVGPGYIADVMADLLQPGVGVVTCLYRGLPTAGFSATLEALGMSVELQSGVLVANTLEGMKFALGPTMAISSDCLEAIGGFPELRDYLADDFVLGNRAAAAGYKVVLSRCVIDHVVLQTNLASSIQHQVRWSKSTRRSRPKGHLGTALTFAMPYGILGALACVMSRPPFLGILAMPHLGLAMLLGAFANRVLQCWAVGYVALDDSKALTLALLYPLRDLLGFFFWAASYFGGRETSWRGERYVINSDGRMVRQQALQPVGTKGFSA
ncbi:MAG TPA: bacteriohopanetetrol glucosamine biosynthesis glycosyltransferase HpnI [Terriglobales bacterium]|nr:bacteriohopanetetrol glucosamine biosynthesis glycosyltransferase HpnI [Terriglobales bacterium]